MANDNSVKGNVIRDAGIICVGTELLLGEIVNTDAAFISRRLAALGIGVFRQYVVGDNPGRLKEMIGAAYSRTDTLIFSGGLGPTADDLTKETVAEWFGKKLVRDERTAARIGDYFCRSHRRAPHSNEKQAYVPEGSVVLDNDYGTAPGIIIEEEKKKKKKTAVLLPGPPSELEPLFLEKVEPYLMERSGGTIVSRNICLIGIGESEVGDIIAGMMESDNPTVAPYCGDGEVRVRVAAKAADAEKAAAAADAAVGRILGTGIREYVYGIDARSPEAELIARLREKGMTLATAESCTGGMLSERITSLAGCSDVFLGGCVTYANGAKTDLLGVPSETIEKFGAVSAETAAAMAIGARERLGASVGLSATGIAGPGGGTPEKPVGTVWIGVSTPDGTAVRKLSLSPTRTRDQIRKISCTALFGFAIFRISSDGRPKTEGVIEV